MTPSLNSQTFKAPTSILPSDDTVRDIAAHLPVVIFAKAIAEAFFKRAPSRPAPVATRTFRTR
jgi:hypothetical protein